MMRFKKVYIEITNQCNLDCDFCPKCTRAKRFMTEQELDKILEKLRPYTKYVYFHLMGEPLLHPKLKDFLDLADQKGFKVNLTTNGTLLKYVETELLTSPALRQINISVHSFEANQNQGTMEDYIEDIIAFTQQAKIKSELIISLRLWNLDNQEDKGKNSLNEGILNLLLQKLASPQFLDQDFAKSRGLKIDERLYINQAEKFEWAVVSTKPESENKFCYGLRDQIGILVDGTLVPCCLDNDGNIPLGNIFESEMETILESDRAKAIYEGFSQRKAVEDLCKKCHFRV